MINVKSEAYEYYLLEEKKSQYETMHHYICENGFPDAVVLLASGENFSPDLERVFSLDANLVCGVAMSAEIRKRAGGMNKQIPAGALWELLCRVCALTRNCQGISILSSKQFQESICEPENEAFVKAYAFRYHMKALYANNEVEPVFQDLCRQMQDKGCFEAFQQYFQAFLNNENVFDKIAIDTAPFIVLRGDDTCMGVLQRFADDLAKALEARGEKVILVGEDEGIYDQLAGGLYKGMIGFQTRALEIEFFRRLKGPKFHFWMDYPLHFKGILRDLGEEYFILCQDSGHAMQIRDYFHTANAIQFPPGGVKQETIDGERPLDIVFMGSFFADASQTLTLEQKAFYDYMIDHPGLSFEQGLAKMQGLSEEERISDIFAENMYGLKPACRAVIGYYRQKVVETILQAGFIVHVYGEDWKGYTGEGKEGLVIHPLVSVEESLEELRRAKIGLNIMSWHKEGMTERIANIMLSGAVCVSDETGFLRRNLTEEEIVLFDLTRLDQLVENLSKLLSEADYRERIARNGHKKAMAEYTWDVRAKQLIALSDQYYREKDILNIFVATHVPFCPPKNPIYVPLQVGKSGKKDLGYIGDDTGVNISDLNYLYGELTGLFWIWQNITEPEYVGLCHYRRYFINDRMQAMEKREYLSLLRDYDAIVPKHMECEGGISYREHFGQAHNVHDLDAVGSALRRLYPEYVEAYTQAMQGSIYYWGNLVVTSLPILKAYSQWLFNIFAEAGEEIDVSGYDAYHKRVFGFLSEQMFYVFALANALNLREVSVGVSAEKAETMELKRELTKLLEKGQKEQARALYEKRMAERPDLMLPGSDIHRELEEIVRQIM